MENELGAEELSGEESGGVTTRQEEILRNLADAELNLDIVLLEKSYEIGSLMSLTPGSIMMFDVSAEAPVWLSVNGKRFAYGDVVRQNDMYGMRITKMAKS